MIIYQKIDLFSTPLVEMAKLLVGKIQEVIYCKLNDLQKQVMEKGSVERLSNALPFFFF